jgi:hypothetical protein
MKKELLVMCLFMAIPLSKSWSQNLYNSANIRREGNECLIVSANLRLQWPNSPCEKLYGSLPGVATTGGSTTGGSTTGGTTTGGSTTGGSTTGGSTTGGTSDGGSSGGGGGGTTTPCEPGYPCGPTGGDDRGEDMY